jgi:hypothetical protein
VGAPLLDVDRARAELDAPAGGAVFGNRWGIEQILTLESFLSDYHVSLAV